MPGIVGNGVTLRGLSSEDFKFTWNITGTGGVAPSASNKNTDVPMMIDSAADNSAKQVTDGAVILGRLESFENRVQEGLVVGTISHKCVAVFDYTGTAPTRGNSVVGSATANKVKAAAAAVGCIVVEVDTVNSQVAVILG